jgi:Ca2+-binding RTX toxin-like protein
MKRALPILLTAFALLPATASADSTLSYTDATGRENDVVRVSNSDVAGFEVSYSTGCFFSCSFEIESLQQFVDNAAACVETSGGDNTTFSCDAEPTAGLQVPGNINVTGSTGADSVEGNCFLSSPRLTVNAGDGDDRVTLGIICVGNHIINLEGGNDSFEGGVTSAFGPGPSVTGGTGNDDLKGGVDPDTLDGGDGRDSLSGRDGADVLRGGAGRDLLIPGPGNRDNVEGGADVDAASFEDRAAAVTASLDNADNDGAAGENDRIASDVENIIGGAGEDTLTGDGNPNDIDGGDGGDVINPGGGPDFVDGGPGNDRIEARDGAQDRILCGEGNDLAVTDEFDTVVGCETVQASRELMPDVDADGVPAPADCNDRDARRRPGFTDKPGNGIDEDCVGGDAPFTRILSPVQSTFAVSGSRTRVLRLRVLAVPEGGRVELRCRPAGRQGCFRGVKRFRSPRGAEQLNVLRPVRRSRLRTGARLEVRVLDADSIGKVVQFTMRAGKLPRSRTLCLVPGRRSPGRCPRL